MVDSGANIDIVFRNGLKDYEVLPPPDVWDNINPVVIAKRKQKPFIFLKVAASVAVLVASGYLIYRWESNMPADYEIPVVASYEEAQPSSEMSVPLEKNVPIKNPAVISGESASVRKPENILTGNTHENSFEINKNTAPEIDFTPKANKLPLSSAGSFAGQYSTSISPALKKSFNPAVFEKSYSPRYSTVISGYGAIDNSDKWSIAAIASPTYSARVNFANDGLSKQLKGSEKPVVSYSGGVAVAYLVNKRFSIQSGLFYSSVGQEVDGISSFSGFRVFDDSKGDVNFKVLTSDGIINANNSDVYLVDNRLKDRVLTSYTAEVFDPAKANLTYVSNTVRQNFSYLELPITMRYKIVDKTVDVNLIGGVSYNFLVNNSVYTVSNGSKYFIGKTEGLNQMALSSSLGMGMEYKFSGNLYINLEPTFRYYLNPFRNATSSKIHPYSIGIFSGVSYRF